MSVSTALQNFMSAEIEEELVTEYGLCPEFEEVPAVIDSYKIFEKTVVSADGETEELKLSLVFTYSIDDQEAREALNRDKVLVNGEFIRLNLVKGKLDITGNQKLARMAKLLSNSPVGQTAGNFLESFKGSMVTAKVVHVARQVKEGDDWVDLVEDGNVVYNAVVSAIAV